MATRPIPVGWTPKGTYTGNPARLPAHVDRWDCSPSKNPYPLAMPALTHSGRAEPDQRFRALQLYNRVVHEHALRLVGGERGLLRELQTNIRRRKAVSEELGTGVVLLSPTELAILDMDPESGAPA